MIEKFCGTCGSKYETDKKSFFKYCSTLCRSRDKFITVENGTEKPFKVWKMNYQKYPDFYLSLNWKNRLNNKCFVCGKEYSAFRMCCGKDCSLEMKRQTTLDTTGSEHNLSRDSKSRSNMKENLMNLYGINNVYQRNDVKEKLKQTWSLKYGFDNPSKSEIIKGKKRKEAEKNGFWIPREKWSLRKIYEANVQEITWSQIKKFARLKFGDDIWDRIKESRKLPHSEWLTIDHRYSRSYGFLNNIGPDVIGHICNLDVLTFEENRNKWSECSITIEELKSEIEKFNRNIKNEN
jgi:hypothetical protein